MRVQQVTLSIIYDETEFDEPSSWNWADTIEGVNEVALIEFGPVYKMEKDV